MREDNTIENTFKEKFNPADINSEGWNSPRAAVWDNIENQLDANKTDRKGVIFFFFGLSILAILLSAYLFQQNHNLNKQLTEVNQMKATDDTFSNSLDVEKSSTPEKSIQDEIQKISPSTQIAEARTNDLSKNVIENANQNSNSNSKLNLAFYGDSPTNLPSSKNFNPIVSDKNHLRGNGQIKLLENYSNNDLYNSPSTPSIRTLHSRLQYDRPTQLLKKKITPAFAEPITKSTKSILSFYGGYINGGLNSIGAQNSSLFELIDKEYGKEGYSFNATLGLPISNSVSIGAGLGVAYNTYITEYDLTLMYDENLEQIENGVGFIDFEHSLPTSFGNTDTEITLTRSNLLEPLTDPNVVLDYNTNHRLIQIDLPMTVDYNFSELGSGLSLGLALIPSYIINTEAGIEEVISHHDQVGTKNNFSHSFYNDINRFNIATGVNLNYRIPINTKGGVQLGLRYHHNLFNHYSNESFQSKRNGIRFVAGYYFGL